MDIGIALDGEGRLGRPEAVTAVAAAADLLDYGTIWCIGPWAAALAGAVAAVTVRIRIGLEPPVARDDSPPTAAVDRLVIADLALWPSAPTRGPDRAPVRPVRLDVVASRAQAAEDEVRAARASGVAEVVVRLVGDPDVDEALAAYAVLAELAEGSAAGG